MKLEELPAERQQLIFSEFFRVLTASHLPIFYSYDQVINAIERLYMVRDIQPLLDQLEAFWRNYSQAGRAGALAEMGAGEALRYEGVRSRASVIFNKRCAGVVGSGMCWCAAVWLGWGTRSRRMLPGTQLLMLLL